MTDHPALRSHAPPPLKVSVVLLTYQQERFVRQGLESLLLQDFPNLQIVISDDASTDHTWDVIEQTLQDVPSHARIVLNRNPVNVGLVNNYNRAVSLCDGELIFSAAGDDVSELNRLSACVALWLQTGQTFDLIATDLVDMSLEGLPLGVKAIDDLQTWNWKRWMHQKPYHAGASHMATRRLLFLQPLNPRAAMEDQCLLFRALLMGGALRLPKPLVHHRRGGVSNDGHLINSYAEKRAELLSSADKIIHLMDQYLGDAKKLNAPDQLLHHLTQTRRAAIFSQHCLAEKRFFKRLLLLFEFQDVALRKLVRFLVFSSMKHVYDGMYKVKFFIRSQRKN